MDAIFRQISQDKDDYKRQMEEAEDKLRLMVVRLQEENMKLREENERLRIANQLPQNAAELGIEELGQTFERCHVLRSHEMEVHAATMSSEGILAAASWDATVSLYDLSRTEDEICLKSLGVDEAQAMGGLYDVAFAYTNPDILGCASADHSIYLWKSCGRAALDEPPELVRTCSEHSGEVNCVRFHPKQPVMLSCSDDCTAIVWDFQEGIALRCLDDHENPVYGGCFLDPFAEYQVATCCFDKKIRIFDMRTKQIIETLQEHTDDIVGLDFGQTSSLLASGSDDGLICVWDVRNLPEPLFKIDTRESPGIPDNEVKRVRLSTDARQVAGGCSSSQMIIYDISGSTPVCTGVLGGHTDCVFDVCWGVDDSGQEYVVGASHDTTLSVWRPTAG